jgi:purine-binding chemotaxis protein CheW
MGKSEYTGNTCLIVFELQIKGEKIYLGAIVDEVLSVIEIMKRDVEPPPNIGNSYKSEFIYGMVKSDDKFIMLMDMHQVISENDMDSINQKKQENITE